MTSTTHNVDRGMRVKTAITIGILVIVFAAMPVRSAASSESPAAGAARFNERAIFVVGAGPKLALTIPGEDTSSHCERSETISSSQPGYDHLYASLDDPPQSRYPAEETTPVAPDSAIQTSDSLSHAPADYGPPAPRRRVAHKGQITPPGGFFHSPTGALLKSVAFPGWGQWSNGKKQKAAIYFGIETYFLTKAFIWGHRASDRLRVWEGTSRDSTTALNTAFNSYNSARDRRNYFYWLTGITAFVSMFDAYADCYLLTLERTRKMGDDYWGGQTRFAPGDEIRLAVTLRF